MKSLNPALTLLVLAATATGSGCAAQKHPLLLERVGPALAALPAAHPNGTLVVFSALDPNAHFNSWPDRAFYTDYKVLSENGALVRTVHNDNGTSLEGPLAVSLPPGEYRVMARANGFGDVCVPVLIQMNRVTTVHLEGGHAEGNVGPIHQDRAVRLPDGRIIGWRAPIQAPAEAAAALH